MSPAPAHRSLFTLPDDLSVREPEIAQLIEDAAGELHRAHRMNRPDDIEACLARADAATLNANGAFAQKLGPHTDPAVLLPLMRFAVQAVEAVAHHEACGISPKIPA